MIKIYDYQTEPDEVEKKLTDLEDRTRRINLRIDEVAEGNGEGWDDCKQRMKEIFMVKLELGADISLKELIVQNKQMWQRGSTPNNSM